MRRFTLVGGNLFVFSLLVMPSRAATAADVSLDAVLSQYDARAGIELLELCVKLNRPCGEELAPGYRIMKLQDLRQSPELHFKNSTASRILDVISLRYPGHQWAIHDGVLILEPKNRVGEDLLDRRLDYVSILGRSSYEAAKMVFAQAKINVGSIYVGPPMLYGRISVSLKNVTVREALNAIVKADGQAMWTFDPNEKNTLAAFNILTWRKTGITANEN